MERGTVVTAPRLFGLRAGGAAPEEGRFEVGAVMTVLDEVGADEAVSAMRRSSFVVSISAMTNYTKEGAEETKRLMIHISIEQLW